MERLSERPRCMLLMLMSASPMVRPTMPMAPGRSWWRETSMLARRRQVDLVAVEGDQARLTAEETVPATERSPPESVSSEE